MNAPSARRPTPLDGVREATPFVKQVYRRYVGDGVAESAAALSYCFVFALFPFLFLLTTLTAYFPYFRTSADTLLSRARDILPPQAMRLVSAHVEGLVATPRPRFLVVSLLLALYSTSRGVNAVRTALNLAHDVEESRPLWKTEALAFGMTAGGTLLVLGAVAGLAAGGSAGFWLARQVGAAAPYLLVWRWLRWPITAGAIALSAALAYHLLPDVDRQARRFQLLTPGSLLGTLSWFLATWGFGEYAAHFGSYNVTYGAIGGVVVLMTWFYLTGFIFLLGGEINVIVERRRCSRPPEEEGLDDQNDEHHEQHHDDRAAADVDPAATAGKLSELGGGRFARRVVRHLARRRAPRRPAGG